MGSRPAYDYEGRLVAIETDGKVWLVIDMFEIFTPRGRPTTAREMATPRAPYDSNTAKRARREQRELPDEELAAEEAAIAAAYAEQRRTPPDLVNVAA